MTGNCTSTQYSAGLAPLPVPCVGHRQEGKTYQRKGAGNGSILKEVIQ